MIFYPVQPEAYRNSKRRILVDNAVSRFVMDVVPKETLSKLDYVQADELRENVKKCVASTLANFSAMPESEFYP